MAKRKVRDGICRLCKKHTKLSFEHIPPRVAFNKNTRFYSISQEEFIKSENFLEYKPKGIVQQGGLGYYTLCKECNSFLGASYVKSFAKWANLGMSLNLKYNCDFYEITALNQNPIRILKQIISMFICMNEPWFTEEYPELLDFIKNPDQKELPAKYKIYNYLNNEGEIRNYKWAYTNTYGAVCELAFPPFGYVLNIDNPNEISHLTNITDFKNYPDSRDNNFKITLLKHPTYLPIPLDYRGKAEIENAYKEHETSRIR